MICRSCLRASRTLRPTPLQQPSHRFLSTTTTLLTTPAPATSTSAAQPFSEPLTPAPKGSAAPPKEKKTVLVKSSVPAGTPLKGLNFLKNAQDPVAKADDEYPAWLWTILERGDVKGGDAGMGDLFSKSKKQRRVAAKRLRKEQAMNPGMLIPKVPIYEQTVDLPAGDGSLQGAHRAGEARGELTKAMRDKRRATIKEANFLKAMG